MAIVGLSPQILEKREEEKERRKRRMAQRRNRERERGFSQLGVQKARDWP
jgi:hypothetical protein